MAKEKYVLREKYDVVLFNGVKRKGEFVRNIVTYPNKIKKMLENEPELRLIAVEPLPQYWEDVDPTLIKNVTDHVDIYGDTFRYIRGLTKQEKAVAVERAENKLSPSIVARIQFRKGARWYWIYAECSKEAKHDIVDGKEVTGKEYNRARIRATPVYGKEIKVYLDKRWPLGDGSRKHVAPRVVPVHKKYWE